MLLLIRHGRTALNAAGRLQGLLDVPLDDVGLAQADAVAKRVGAVDELITSPLSRAVQTAEAFGQPYTVDERWIELSYGVYEGESVASVPSEAWEHWRTDPSFEPVGGESLLTLDQRVRGACEDLIGRAADRRVAVVSHVSPIKAAVAWTLGAGVQIAWRSHLDHASICRIDVGRSGPLLVTFNETVDT